MRISDWSSDVCSSDLARAAETTNDALKFEAAVAGGIPVIKGLREGAAANEIGRVYGVLNGTCNFILSKMESEGRDFGDVLAEAQIGRGSGRERVCQYV